MMYVAIKLKKEGIVKICRKWNSKVYLSLKFKLGKMTYKKE